MRFNDEPSRVRADLTVAALIAERYAGRRWLAVAVDGEVVPRGNWADRPLHVGALVEILTAVEGG